METMTIMKMTIMKMTIMKMTIVTMAGRPSARALELAEGVWGHRRSAASEASEHRTSPHRS